MKKFFFKMVTALVLCFYSISANASVEGAKTFIKDLGETTIDIAKSDKMPLDEKEQKLIALFEKSVDTHWIAKFVMGQYWRDMKAEKREAYKKLYQDYLIRSYVPKFKTYTDEKINILSATEEYKTEYLVNTEIVASDGQTYRVNYKVKEDETGNYKIFDIIAEGISLITTQRSEFGSIISRDGIDSLLKKLEKKETKK
jgi:phospholipid transport system substrate-binding protein